MEFFVTLIYVLNTHAKPFSHEQLFCGKLLLQLEQN